MDNLLFKKKFWPIFWTQFLGAFNDNVFKNALVLLIIIKSYALGPLKTNEMVAMCGGIFILPFFLFSAISGKLADKYSKSKCILWIKISELIIMILASYGFITENLNVLLMTLFFMGLQSTLFGPIKYSILPELVDENELVQGNAYINMGTFVSILLGTILGGTLIAIPEMGSKLISIAIISIALLGIFTGKNMTMLSPTNGKLKLSINPITPTIDILKITRQTKSVFLAVLGISWFWFLGVAFLSLIPPYAKDYLNANESVITLFLALFSVGIGVGSIICEKLSCKRLELGLVPIGSIGMSIFLLDLYFIGLPSFISQVEGPLTVTQILTNFSSIRIVIDMLLFSIFGGFYIVPLYTMIQMRTEAGIRSQTVAGNNILNALFMVVASVMLIALFKLKFSIPEIFLVLFALNILVAIYIYSVIPEFMYRFLCFILSHLIYRLKVIGRDNIPATGACILVCNHVSFVDWLFISSGCLRPPRFIMDFNYIKTSLGRAIMRQMKVIPIATKSENRNVLKSAFEQANNELSEGEIICIFPEGEITKTGEINKFKKGVERLAKDNRVSVIPMSLQGLWGSFFSRKHGRAMSTNPFRKLFCKVTLTIGHPIEHENITAEDLEKMVKEMYQNN